MIRGQAEGEGVAFERTQSVAEQWDLAVADVFEEHGRTVRLMELGHDGADLEVPIDLFRHAAQLAALLEACNHGAEILARHRSLLSRG